MYVYSVILAIFNFYEKLFSKMYFSTEIPIKIPYYKVSKDLHTTVNSFRLSMHCKDVFNQSDGFSNMPLFLFLVAGLIEKQSTFSTQNPRASGGYATFQIVCYDWISLYFCKQRRENWDRSLWKRTTTTQNVETLLLQAISQRLQAIKCSYNEEQDFRESQHYFHGLNWLKPSQAWPPSLLSWQQGHQQIINVYYVHVIQRWIGRVDITELF